MRRGGGHNPVFSSLPLPNKVFFPTKGRTAGPAKVHLRSKLPLQAVPPGRAREQLGVAEVEEHPPPPHTHVPPPPCPCLRPQVASESDEVAARAQALLSTPRFRCYRTTDVIGGRGAGWAGLARG